MATPSEKFLQSVLATAPKYPQHTPESACKIPSAAKPERSQLLPKKEKTETTPGTIGRRAQDKINQLILGL